MIKDIFIDVETTGLDPVEHGIIQIAAMIEIKGEIVKTLDLNCSIFQDDAVSEKALAVNKITFNQIKEYPDPVEVHKILTDTMGKYVDPYDPKDKFHFIAYNAPFDMEFLREWFANHDALYDIALAKRIYYHVTNREDIRDDKD